MSGKMNWNQLLSNKRLGQEGMTTRRDDRTEFQRDYETGYYEREDSRGKVRKICKTLQTLLDTLEMFPEHREELLEMFNYKMSNLKNPILWE